MDYVSILKESFENPFNINSYRNFIVNFLKGSELKPINGLRSAEIFAEFSYYVQGFAIVAEYTSPKREKVGVYAVKLKAGRDIEKARSLCIFTGSAKFTTSLGITIASSSLNGRK